MIDQNSVINLAIQSGVIDKADTVGQYISQAYIDDLAHFADLAQQVERANIIDMLWRFAANLMAVDDYRGRDVIQLAIGMIEEAAE